VTRSLVRRTFEHKNHTRPGFTSRYEAVRLLYHERFGDVRDAIAREKQLKGWRREKKIALVKQMNPGWVDLSQDWFIKPPQQRS
jgi:putative endonuclease